MKKRLKAILALMLCAAMLCSAVPAAATSPEEVLPAAEEIQQIVEETTPSPQPEEQSASEVLPKTEISDVPGIYEVATSTATQSIKMAYEDLGDGYYIFETMQDLKKLAGKNFNDAPTLIYVGSSPFKFQSITISKEMNLVFYDTQVIVPSGVKVNLTHADSILATEDIQIAGTLNCTSYQLSGSMEVTGSLNVKNDFLIEEGGSITGKNKIVIQDGEGIFLYYFEEGIFALDDALAEAKKSDDSRDVYYVLCENTTNASLSGEYWIPKNCIVEIHSRGSLFCVFNDAVRVDGELYLAGIAQFEGTLENNGFIGVYADGRNGHMKLRGATYTGKGLLFAQARVNDLSVAFSGLDLDKFEVKQYRNKDTYCWDMTYLGNLVKLEMATDLQWGYGVELNRDADGKKYTERVNGIPGQASWKNPEIIQDYVRVEYYQVQEEEDLLIYSMEWPYESENCNHIYDADSVLTILDPPSGDYYFTVTILGDYETYANSNPAVSPIWYYEKPAAQLGACTNLTLDGNKATWTGPENAGSYEIIWYYAPTETAEPEEVCTVWEVYETQDVLTYDWIQEHGAGYYSARVRAISSDLWQICNGTWSEMSEPVHITKLEPGADDLLDEIMQDSFLLPDEKLDAARELDAEELKSAMMKDPAVAEQLAKLEQQAGHMVEVEVAETIDFFQKSLIRIVGAGLNEVVNPRMTIKLIIDQPENTPVLPEKYKDATAVSFSMKLENVKSPQKLALPVEVTLPIPADMEPKLVRILQYNADGGYELLELKTYTEEGRNFVTFVLDRFSDFVMLSGVAPTGDINGDGKVNDQDVIALLWHTLFSDMYPIDADGDINADGKVNDQDVIALLWHTLFPEMYPL